MSTKEKIMRALIKLSAENGLGNVSLSDIAEKVGIRKATLYSHFDSKAQIIEELYEYLRKKSMETLHSSPIDYEKLVEGKSAKEILNMVIGQYEKLNSNEEMTAFYKLIYSERVFSAQAAKIMATETNKMELTTRQLFYALQAHKLLKFEDITSAALIFSMTVHSLLDRKRDFVLGGLEDDTAEKMQSFINEFCNIYKWEN